ncbi:MAG: DNA helicase RecQ [Candidatus Poribacteria bacterium]|nr:DNA helicase RecQ [Candidatus Poribacteria bacterium]
MRVLIVAKTRMGGGACIGGITETGKSVRLIPFNADPHDGANREYNVGEIWEITAKPETSLIPPHNENIVVYEKQLLHLAKDPKDLVSAIELLMPPKIGHPRELYDGLLQNTESGRLHIAKQSSIPTHSTTFWRPDMSLTLDIEKQKPRYRYPTENGGCTFTFGGFQEPLEIIPENTLLRVSLAHWWRPEDKPEVEERCYAQISGWFLEEEIQEEQKPFREEKLPPSQTLTQSPLEILQNVFGHEEFRPFQEEIIKHILKGQDALIVLPTGGGKSLCYQLPSLIFDGLTVVVSPLKSLMQDQVMQLEQRGIRASFLNSDLSLVEQEATMHRVLRGEVKLLYLAPETLVKPGTLLKLDRSNVSCLAIDEAHCISQWGHDFRLDYRELDSVRERFQNAVCLAMTATATPRVQEDIKQSLKFPKGSEFVDSFDRKNLFIAVEPKVELLTQTLSFLNKNSEGSGIIYCQRRKQVESLYQDLIEHGISALPYHAGLDIETRKQNQAAFMNGDVRVIVATIAFGMGIDKADVRFVLHAWLPKNPESYYQEIGRAGRDGLRSECLLLFDYEDADIINDFITQGAPSEQEGRFKRLQALVSWATTTECRRKVLLAYFEEEYKEPNCEMCDNCRKTDEKRVDLTEPAQKFLSGVYRTNQIFGEVYIIDVLRGSKQRKVLDNEHDQIKTYGKGKEYNKEQWRYLAHQFLQDQLLDRDKRYGSLRLTEKGWAVLKSREKYWGFPVNMVNTIIEVGTDTYNESNTYAPELFEQLRTKRKGIADQERLPAYCIFHNKTLQAMANQLPQSVEEFRKIYGIGSVKTQKYADDFLPIIRAYCEEHRIDPAKRETKTLNTNDVTSEVVNKYDQELFELLHNKCKVLARAEGGGIFTNRTLKAMAVHLPQTKKEFRQIHGVGFVKTKKYADIFLEIIRDYCEKHRSEFSRNTTEAPNEYSPELFELLQAERDKIFETEGDRVYEAFHDKALQTMATYFPRSEESFSQISSVGPERFKKYSDIFFPIIRDYCKEHGIDSIKKKPKILNTYEATSQRQSEYSQELFELLQDKCKTLEKAEQEGIFTDRMLREMATSFPRTREAFVQIRGVSLRKMEKYADVFLPIIRAYCEENGIIDEF